MKQTLSVIIFLVVWSLFCKGGLAGQDVTPDDHPEGLNKAREAEKSAPFFPIKFYQDYISSADGDRCPMQPTCSQYCAEAFRKHGTLLGWIMCSDRLMRCGRDEKRLSDPVWINGKKYSYDPVSNNDFWW